MSREVVGQEFRYDIAVSFLAEDEALATQQAELLRERISVFIYAEHQEVLAGKNGEAAFNRIFGSEARIVAVIYREGWGDTPWSRIEETAIRNRAYDTGYDFAIFIPAVSQSKLPAWVPKNRLWMGLERWGVDAAAAVLEASLQESGGTPRNESLAERAARIQRQREFAAGVLHSWRRIMG